MKFKATVLIPIYNNHDTIAKVVERLLPLDLPFLIVDDGSSAKTHEVLQQLADSNERIQVLYLPQNAGKGAAVKEGLLLARNQSYTHALQVDADGQHCLEDAPAFIAAALAKPEALVLGSPIFDASVPKARLHGRKLSVWLANLETLGRVITDPLIGFRVYPVAASAKLIESTYMGTRMDFDPEIAVRLYWAGVDIVNIATAVCYPVGGTSHFRMVRDNFLMTLLHFRLVFGLLIRLPRLLARRRSS